MLAIAWNNNLYHTHVVNTVDSTERNLRLDEALGNFSPMNLDSLRAKIQRELSTHEEQYFRLGFNLCNDKGSKLVFGM